MQELGQPAEGCGGVEGAGGQVGVGGEDGGGVEDGDAAVGFAAEGVVVEGLKGAQSTECGFAGVALGGNDLLVPFESCLRELVLLRMLCKVFYERRPH